MQQHAAALDMTEKTIAEPGRLMRAFDQAWNVRQHESPPVGIHDAELRMQRSEWIVGDLRLGRADHGKESRFPGIGEADQAGIRDQFQPQPDPALLTFLSGIGVAWRAVGGRLEMRVAEAAIAAFGEHESFAERGEVVDQRFAVLVEHLRAHRHLQHDRLAVGTMAVLAHAVGALLRLEVLLIAIVDQRVQAIDRLDDDVAAAAAIAAARSAEFDILLAAERHAAVAAVAGADIDFCLVKKFHGVSVSQGCPCGNLYLRNTSEKPVFSGFIEASRDTPEPPM